MITFNCFDYLSVRKVNLADRCRYGRIDICIDTERNHVIVVQLVICTPRKLFLELMCYLDSIQIHNMFVLVYRTMDPICYCGFAPVTGVHILSDCPLLNSVRFRTLGYFELQDEDLSLHEKRLSDFLSKTGSLIEEERVTKIWVLFRFFKPPKSPI